MYEAGKRAGERARRGRKEKMFDVLKIKGFFVFARAQSLSLDAVILLYDAGSVKKVGQFSLRRLKKSSRLLEDCLKRSNRPTSTSMRAEEMRR